METRREEAAPTFPTWRRRLEEAKREERQQAVERFLQVLKAVGTPMIDGSAVHFLYYGPEAQRVLLSGEFNQWDRRGLALTPFGQTRFFYHTPGVCGPARGDVKFIADRQCGVDPVC